MRALPCGEHNANIPISYVVLSEQLQPKRFCKTSDMSLVSMKLSPSFLHNFDRPETYRFQRNSYMSQNLDHTYTSIYVFTYIYIYIQRERERAGCCGAWVFADPLFVSYLHSNNFKHLKGTRITPQSPVHFYS